MVREDATPPIPECPAAACRREPLDVFQPSVARPDVVLGYCWSCGELYRLEPDGAGWRVDEDARPVAVGAHEKPPGHEPGGTNSR